MRCASSTVMMASIAEVMMASRRSRLSRKAASASWFARFNSRSWQAQHVQDQLGVGGPVFGNQDIECGIHLLLPMAGEVGESNAEVRLAVSATAVMDAHQAFRLSVQSPP